MRGARRLLPVGDDAGSPLTGLQWNQEQEVSTVGRRIFVGNLWYGTNEESLRGFFDNGERKIVDVRIITDRETGRSRGFGFVEFNDEKMAQDAIDQLHGAELDGRRLAVKEAFDRQRSDNGGSNNGASRSNEPFIVEERGSGEEDGRKSRRRQRRRRRDMDDEFDDDW